MKILYLPNFYSQQRQRDVKANIYPVLMAMEAQWYKQQGDKVEWGMIEGYADKIITEPENLPFLSLPCPDRVFTRAKEYTSGNYKYLPATHMQVANGCWWAKCSFCVEKGKPYEVRPIHEVINEIQECVRLGFREVFDDSGTFPTGEWLREFCQWMISTGLNKKVVLGCNMRFGVLDLGDYDLMKRAGFRMILWGVESVNQSTLDRLNKGIRADWVEWELRLANNAGLWNHLAVMVSYPWETLAEKRNTYNFVKKCLLSNIAKTAQASLYDVGSVDSGIKSIFRKKVYQLYFHPLYLWQRIKEVRSWDDIKYLVRGIKKLWRRNG